MPRKLNGFRQMPDVPASRRRIAVPLWVVLAQHGARLLGRALVLIVRHPLVTAFVAGLVALRVCLGWRGVLAGVATVAVLLVAWRVAHPRSFAAVRRWARGRWRLA